MTKIDENNRLKEQIWMLEIAAIMTANLENEKPKDDHLKKKN